MKLAAAAATAALVIGLSSVAEAKEPTGLRHGIANDKLAGGTNRHEKKRHLGGSKNKDQEKNNKKQNKKTEEQKANKNKNEFVDNRVPLTTGTDCAGSKVGIDYPNWVRTAEEAEQLSCEHSCDCVEGACCMRYKFVSVASGLDAQNCCVNADKNLNELFLSRCIP